ncbi:MAG: neutral zinc metallopeptidase [Candidatus Accumulibacter sp.]|jgi:predicted metalloprotease|uniref:KPN_02809 family neutral zinc metallopeptidase n=1 Tax=Accumulibacter sp. TaxID=2053492 RepID=UPI001AD4A555|nr:neutral zinc metallopeptidase [Accumulibacter sp.]MBK8114715.1 neutral zinc metallopeptidase [Accumulibacter sp.]MBK8385001.1 neutral zinc metallopeptidase [Accumulibacter sp.]MBK8577690.1 neutral zinc metallopeptidase [Candidatus Accumulibacter propinquus]MBN8438362.1 neutral zinc metallopeptidase [Accumulibacter sp.]
MRLEEQGESLNIEDRRGGDGGIGRGSIGIGTLLVALAAGYFFGVDPAVILGLASSGNHSPVTPQPAQKPPANDEMARFVAKVLGSTEATWRSIFDAAGRRYQEPKLVLFTGATPTACGTGRSAMGPFYCPSDQKVYIDLAFYRDLRERFHAPGEFAQAYVIAHEVGHHVQNLLGISDKVHAAQQRSGNRAGANALSVRLELQADCFAGVWGHRADSMQKILEPGETEQALTAASAIGDDRLQRQTQGQIVPESFTHGTSAQRVRWFKRGMDSGDIRQCDTFSSASL